MNREKKELRKNIRPLSEKEIEEIIMSYPEQMRRRLARLDKTALGILAQDVAARYDEINNSAGHE